MIPQFGGKITKSDLERYSQSPNWRDGVFQNLEPTEVMAGLYKFPGMIYKSIKGIKDNIPKQKLPILPFDMQAFEKVGPEFHFIWYGHSALLLKMNGLTLMIDPMFGPDTSPSAPIKTKRFSENTIELLKELPKIDLIMLTHDHYDHLDLESIKILKGKTDHFFTALGVKRHLTYWGVEEDKVTEFDWWDTRSYKGLDIHFTPTRHFSGRGLKDRAKSLWGGWVLESEMERVWFSGDGGYGEHFKAVGKRFGSFDLAFMECGQYCDDWAQIHMFPKEAVQAALDAHVKKALPVHWAGFPLSYQHTWYDPVEHFTDQAKENGLLHCTPALGELCSIHSGGEGEWWKEWK